MTNSAGKLFHEGRLDAAIAAAVESIKKDPSAFGPRFLLAELLLFAGDLDRADQHLDAAASMTPQLSMQANALRRLSRGEQARHDFYAAGRVPRFLVSPNAEVEGRLRAAIAIREGDTSAAAAALAEAERVRPRPTGVCGELGFDDIRDLDDLLGSCLEVLSLAGDYCWIPLADVAQLSFEPPKRPNDLLWRLATLRVRNSDQMPVRVPTLYHGSHRHADDQVRLGRKTTWLTDAGPYVRGLGQKMFAVGTGAVPILEITALTTTVGGNA